MANINLTSGERYTFGKLKGISVISDSTDSAQTTMYIRNTLIITASGGSIIQINDYSTADPYLRFSKGFATADNWSLGIDNSDGGAFKINNAGSLSSGGSMALRIDTDENIAIPGNLEITGSFALGGIANTVTANSLYYDTTTKQVTYGAAGGGGGGTPGGSDTQIQYNNAGVFGGVSALTWNGSLLRATGSFTGSLRGNLIGSASVATSSSYALTASYALNGGGSGTVNSGNSNYLAYYDSTAASISDIYQVGAGVKTNAIQYDGAQWGWGLMFVTSFGVTGSQISPGVNGQDSWLNASGGTVGIGKNSSFAQGKLDVLGNSTITGSLTVTQGVTGSLNGIASSGSTILIQNTPATTGTYYPVFVSNITGYGQARIDNSTYTYNPTTNTLTVTASYAETSSFINPLNQNATLSGSLQITGSLTISGSSTFINIGPAQFTGSVSSLSGYTGSLQGTASFATSASIAGIALIANSTTSAISSSYAATAVSASYALTASYALNSITPSGGEGAIQFTNGTGIAGNSRFTYDNTNNIVNINNGATLNATGSLLGTASVAMSAATTRIATSGIYYPVFVDSANGAAAAETLWTSTGNISMNPASGSINAISVTASLFGTSSWAASATSAPLYLPLAGGTLTGNVSAAARTFTFQDLVLGSGTTFGTIKTDGTKYIGIYPTNGIESTRLLANGNVIHGTSFNDQGYRVQISASTAPSGALYVVGSSLFSGSLTLGNVTSTPSTENTLNVYPPMISGTGEGGQILLAASGGLYTSASMLDTWQDNFRVLKGTNTAGSTAQAIAVNLHTGNLTVGGSVSPGAWTAGQIIQTKLYSASDLSFTTNYTNATNSYTSIVSGTYTPLSNSSYILFEVYAMYEINGGGNDSFFSQITWNGNEVGLQRQIWANTAGGGTRSGTLFPLAGRVTNSSLTGYTWAVNTRRDSSDDTITVYPNVGFYVKITEIGR